VPQLNPRSGKKGALGGELMKLVTVRAQKPGTLNCKPEPETQETQKPRNLEPKFGAHETGPGPSRTTGEPPDFSMNPIQAFESTLQYCIPKILRTAEYRLVPEVE